MKYLILIQANRAVGELFAGMTDEERASAFQTYFDVERDLTDSGELVDSKALATEQKAVLRTASGVVATDAPLPEVTEVVSGYYLVDVEGEQRAVEIAARFPEAVVAGGMRVGRVWTEADFAALGM